MLHKIIPTLLFANLCSAAGPFLGNGVKVGEVDQDSALVWVRLTAEPTADFNRMPIFTEGLAKGEPDKGRMPTDILPGQDGEVLVLYTPVTSGAPPVATSGWHPV